MNHTYGKTIWLIPDCYLEPASTGDKISHEAVCVINTSPKDAEIKLTLFFEDREADSSYRAACSSMRTHHIRLDRLLSMDGREIPRGVPYALLLESSTPIVVQYSRLDTSQDELALMTTIAYALE
mgnify:FL=1|jgi:hypothetical protein